jgi:hypothetical protein
MGPLDLQGEKEFVAYQEVKVFQAHLAEMGFQEYLV